MSRILKISNHIDTSISPEEIACDSSDSWSRTAAAYKPTVHIDDPGTCAGAFLLPITTMPCA
jgi:hypothetical protein